MPDGSFVEPFETQGWSSQLVFYLNGTRIALDGSSIDPDTSLLSFIRSQPGLTGTKLGCGEGGCGACTIVVQSKHPVQGHIQHLAVNACLAPLISVEGKHVITVEALGNSENPHPLQERMWKLSGSQCGFCTPGIVMSVYALLREAAYRGQLTVEDVELEGVLDGNLCRCTGYAPILVAVKSFVGDYLTKVNGNGAEASSGAKVDDSLVVPFNFDASGLDNEDATKKAKAGACCGSNGCSEASTDVSMPVPSGKDSSEPPIDATAGAMGRTAPTGSSTDIKPTKPKGCGRADCCQLDGGKGPASTAPTHSFPRFEFKPYRPGVELIFPPGLQSHKLAPIKFGSKGRMWLRPTTLDQLLSLKAQYPDAKLVGGSSEIAIEVGILGRKYPVCLFVSDIPELYAIELPDLKSDKPTFTFGANTPLSEIEQVCKDLTKSLPKTQAGPFKAIKDQLRYFAGRQVRNTASVAGNIATASPISDLNPVWLATGATLIARNESRGEFELPLASFFVGYRKTTLPADAIIVRIIVPVNTSSDTEVVRAYKQAKRRDDDISIVCACMAMRVDADGTIKSAKLAYGGMAPFTIAATKTQEYLVGKSITSDTLEGALDVLAKEFDLAFDVPGGMAAYRRTLTLSFFFKFFVTVSIESGRPLDVAKELSSTEEITESIHRSISSSTRDNSDPYALEVVGKQEPHMSGLKHVTGEAIYCDDIPSIANEAYVGLVLSQRAHAKIVSVDASEALEQDGVVGFVDHNDVPNERANWWGSAAIDETFFATDEVISHGQIIGAVVAKTKLIAAKAARLVKVEYEDLPVILTIEEAVAAGSFHPQYDRRISRGDEISKAMSESECTLEGATRMGGQEHFYLETMASLVVPKREGGEVEVYSSTQALNDTQRWVAQIMGVPRNRVVAKVKRLGGGFGGKETRSAMLTAVCALAAKKTKRPVRAMLDRDVDIRTTGQRHPCLGEWKVGFTKEGKLTALDVQFYANAGYSLDISGGVCDRALAHLENSYWIPHVDVRARCCKTNTVSNTAYRGFGGPQGMIVAEHYLEAIAEHLNLDIDHVRKINLYKEAQKTPYHQKVLDWHVPRLLEDCRKESDYDQRKQAVEQFNKEHKYRKRGIALVPTKFGLAFGVKAMNQGAALVHVGPDHPQYMDGSVLVAHGGTEMGQGLYTKCCQVAAQELQVPLSSVFTSESATNTVPNAVPTAVLDLIGSAGSDLQAYAVYNACAELNKRLEPYRQKLGPDASFAALAGAAWGDRISLSATGHHATPDLGYVWNEQKETGNLFHYFTQGVAAAEVELDTLTGDHTVLRVDLKMDVGKSLNPAIDYGQIEGAFVQGQGWCTIEESLWLKNGAIQTVGPGAYKIPGFADIPQVFNVALLKDAEWPNLGSIKASKGIGEPPFFLGCSVFLALRQAVKSVRMDQGIQKSAEFRLPLTSERLRLACGDRLVQKAKVEQKEGKEGKKGFFVYI
ncbi:BZ3500_MvSof-1268-A1-R1_Chr5-2g08024 [Microbotryum saponariae]|uniref:xanthine dehydrogenase n=1 Tax=Microbotryum saponariae TaxID=289078 RepID=A0A2X0KMU3_9BASI|nr:BZ3500_MvSof-1268-A1-R1_Chr5-2g08024 [Microbotryum saponariae]SDA05893.1 BZ3501_MvSof-1269-A2-R1_Chr5-2g07846 [Microbotryum saponariae]